MDVGGLKRESQKKNGFYVVSFEKKCLFKHKGENICLGITAHRTKVK